MFQGALRLTNLQAHENKKKLQARENQYFLVFVQNISKHDIKRMKREISDRTKKFGREQISCRLNKKSKERKIALQSRY